MKIRVSRWLAGILLGAAGMSMLGRGGLGQISVEPPAPATGVPAAADTQPAPSVTPSPPPTPGAATASTLPSATSLLEGLLKDNPPASNLTVPANPSPNAKPQVEAVAPGAPAPVRLLEGDSIYDRVGRLVRDEKTGTMLFVFDGDGKQMADPPMGVIPCQKLALMEDQSDGATKPVKFKISAEITEYRGKNYLFPKFVQIVKDLNQGLGTALKPPPEPKTKEP